MCGHRVPPLESVSLGVGICTFIRFEIPALLLFRFFRELAPETKNRTVMTLSFRSSDGVMRPPFSLFFFSFWKILHHEKYFRGITCSKHLRGFMPKCRRVPLGRDKASRKQILTSPPATVLDSDPSASSAGPKAPPPRPTAPDAGAALPRPGRAGRVGTPQIASSTRAQATQEGFMCRREGALPPDRGPLRPPDLTWTGLPAPFSTQPAGSGTSWGEPRPCKEAAWLRLCRCTPP